MTEYRVALFRQEHLIQQFMAIVPRHLGGSSTPIIRDIIRSIKRATNEIRRSHWMDVQMEWQTRPAVEGSGVDNHESVTLYWGTRCCRSG